ncbi:hypothetical protein [Candidatus Fukatsuia symbiotica]
MITLHGAYYNLISNGITLHRHQHSGVKSGGDNSGNPR